MRPSSRRSASSSSSRPGFQTKMKARVKGNSLYEPDQANDKAYGKTSRNNSLHTSRHNHEECAHNDSIFNQTASKLNKTNFDHHDPNLCLCEQCQCGRHLCKFHVIKPDMSKASVYQKSFYNQKAIPNIVARAH